MKEHEVDLLSQQNNFVVYVKYRFLCYFLLCISESSETMLEVLDLMAGHTELWSVQVYCSSSVATEPP